MFSASIPIEVHPGGTQKGNLIQPSSISAVCGFCSKKGVFGLQFGGNLHPQCHPAKGKCPACHKLMSFVFYYDHGTDKDTLSISEIAAFPAPNFAIRIQTPHDMPQRLVQAIRDTEAAYEAGLYSPTLTCGRRALEGVFKHLNDDSKSKKNLANLIQTTLEHSRSSEPLSQLSHAIRRGGNIGAHFDFDFEPDRELAELVLLLLQYLVSYFFLMPEKIAQLEDKISNE